MKKQSDLDHIIGLIDDCIESDDFEEAFYLFVTFVGGLSESDKTACFERYKTYFTKPRG